MHRKHPQPKTYSWFIILSASLFFFYSHIELNIFNAINIPIRHAFHITATTSSALSSFTLLSTLIFIPFAGVLIDRYSPKKIIIYTLSFSIFGTLLLAINHYLLIAFFARFLCGIGSAFCFISILKIATYWFPQKKLGWVTGILVTIATCGGLVAQKPAAILIQQINWRNTLLVTAALGMLILLWIYHHVKDSPAETKPPSQLISNCTLSQLLTVYTNPSYWKKGLYTSSLNLPFWILGASWGIPYLVQTRHCTLSMAASITSLLYIGIMIGSPCFARFADAINNTKIPMILGSICTTLALGLIIYAHTNIPTLSLLFFMLGFSSGAQILTYSLVLNSAPQKIKASSTSVISFITLGGGFLSQIIFGTLLDLGKTMFHTNQYNNTCYLLALTILPICSFLSFIITLNIKHKNPTTPLSHSQNQSEHPPLY
jgi:MFS family permease